ncbi:MAG TPA: hypothetical protein VFH78_05600 [Candidatus Thermoplasmatota archaeon]|nr:hypothetical protein [Candidatus Thermoplasmatota archaeon]
MRLLWLALALVGAGCVTLPSELEGATTDDATTAVPEPFSAEGTVWLPPSTGQSRMETVVVFPVDAGGMGILANVALGSQYGPAELPLTTADVQVQLRAPDGTVLAEASLRGLARQASLEGEAKEAGEHSLAFLSYGGSDGSSTGDHVHWHVETKLS